MKLFFALSVVVGLMGIFGCQGVVAVPDLTPPSAPRGMYTETGDNVLEIFWVSNSEPDLAGYRIYSSTTSGGPFTLLGSTRQPHFVDALVRNGITYYYAVSAYDFSGNESPLSREIVDDTPRPEGYNIMLADYRANPGSAGYDFSTYSVGVYNDQYTDVFFESYNGTYYLDVWDDSNIQDLGYTNSLYDIGYAPTDGWSPTKDVRVIPGHTYAVETWDNHFAKLRVSAVSATSVRFDWAYQLQSGNPRLKQAPPERGSLSAGSGFAPRRNASL